MYGILKVNKCKQTIDQYQTFKTYYCGLCDSLGKNFGNLARATVNYDVTFFYLLLDSLTTDGDEADGFCPTLPWKKRGIIINKQLHQFIGAVNLYLAGLKIQDDIKDENSLTKKVGYYSFQNKFTKAAKILESFGIDLTYVQKLFTQQMFFETQDGSLEKYYQVTAHGLAFLLKEGARVLSLAPDIEEKLIKIGYELGKVIYIMDSFVDYPSDTKNERFNAIAQAFGDQIKLKDSISELVRDEIFATLNESLLQIKPLINQLNLKKNHDLIQLILNELQNKIYLLVKNTKDMIEVEQIIQSSSPTYLLKHPIYFLKSRAAHRRHIHHHNHGCCCCTDCDDLITTAICCDAADCDCDALECLSSGNPCELLECFC